MTNGSETNPFASRTGAYLSQCIDDCQDETEWQFSLHQVSVKPSTNQLAQGVQASASRWISIAILLVVSHVVDVDRTSNRAGFDTTSITRPYFPLSVGPCAKVTEFSPTSGKSPSLGSIAKQCLRGALHGDWPHTTGPPTQSPNPTNLAISTATTKFPQ